MPLTGGRTPLGQELNKQGTKTTGMIQRQKPPARWGRIINIRSLEGQEVYEVKLKWLSGRREESGWLPLDIPAETLALMYGSPRDLKTKSHWCRVEYSGVSSGRGLAILSIPPQRDPDMTAKANQLDIQGATFAPPG